MTVLLEGVVGSTAYGLARPGSDVDRLGVFASSTIALLSLHPPASSIVTTAPDRTLHEALKFCKLALGCNPTVTELLWLPEYEVTSELGFLLVDLRRDFLSRDRVRDAFLGYATQQFRRLERRGDGSFSADTRKRTAKHARHLMRLCVQGLELYTYGTLTVRLSTEAAERCVNFGEATAVGNIGAAKTVLDYYARKFDATTSPLPDRPNEGAIELWLRLVRRANP